MKSKCKILNEFQIINTDNVTVASLFFSFDDEDEDTNHIGTGATWYSVSVSSVSPLWCCQVSVCN